MLSGIKIKAKLPTNIPLIPSIILHEPKIPTILTQPNTNQVVVVESNAYEGLEGWKRVKGDQEQQSQRIHNQRSSIKQNQSHTHTHSHTYTPTDSVIKALFATTTINIPLKRRQMATKLFEALQTGDHEEAEKYMNLWRMEKKSSDIVEEKDEVAGINIGLNGQIQSSNQNTQATNQSQIKTQQSSAFIPQSFQQQFRSPITAVPNNENQKRRKDNRNQTNIESQNRVQQSTINRPQSNPKNSSCMYCPQSTPLSIISYSNYFYLALSPLKIIPTPYWHILLIPLTHSSHSHALQRDALIELTNFKKCLIRMFDSFGQHMVFIEQYLGTSMNGHMVVEGITVPGKKAADVPMYLRQAWEDIQGNWTTHKSIIKVSASQLPSVIPRPIPFVHIDLSPTSGLAHIIEDPSLWLKSKLDKHHYGLLGTIMGLESYQVRDKGEYQKEEADKREEKFKNMWKEHDWTRMIAR